MLLRLWWKEFRVFGPVVLVLLGAAVLLQWVRLSFLGEEVRHGSLTFGALCWAVLYAFAVASAAFSGEREGKTLGFLDAMPVPRSKLWLGKVLYAISSTAGLSLLLIGLGELGTTRRDSVGDNSPSQLFLLFGPLILGGLAWGLFWSALSTNTLLAAVLSVLTVSVSWLPTIDLTNDPFGREEVRRYAIHVAVSLLALAASLAALAWRPNWRGRLLIGGVASSWLPVVLRRSSTGRSLFWQAIREGWSTILLVYLVALIVPVENLQSGAQNVGPLSILLPAVAALVAGVTVFGSENAIGSRQFLVHHGVKPRSVWWRRMTLWGLVMGVLLLLLLLMTPNFTNHELILFPNARSPEQVGALVVSIVSAFTVGVVAGMAIRRRITATLVGAVVLILIAPAQVGLVLVEMIPAWSLILVPSILVAISAAWAGEWLLEPEGPRPWLRLGGLILVPLGLLGGSFIGYRALGVPDFAPQYATGKLVEAVPADQNAASLYFKAIGSLHLEGMDQSRTDGRASGLLESSFLFDWSSLENGIVRLWWEQNREAIELAKQASTLPRLQFVPVERMALDDGRVLTMSDLLLLEQLVALDVRAKMSGGDLAGAWNGILSLFGTSMQLVETTPTIGSTNTSLYIHRVAVGLALEWLADPHQNVASVRKALADLKAIPELPELTNGLRVESLLIERTLDLSGEELTQIIQPEGRRGASTEGSLLYSRVLFAPWERMRARRVCRAIIAHEIAMGSTEPWKRNPSDLTFDQEIPKYQGSRLARMLLLPIGWTLDELDHATIFRRALDQSVALVVWKLEHNGKDAEKLEDIVPSLLARLPLDPYSGKPFGYQVSDGQLIKRWLMPSQLWSAGPAKPTKEGQRLLFSVGKIQSNGKTVATVPSPDAGRPVSGDFLFAIP